METDKLNYRDILRNELARRIDSNERYSLRAFAKSLQINVGALSSILNNKQPLSLKNTHKILDKIELGPAQRKVFIQSVIDEQKSKNIKTVKKRIQQGEFKEELNQSDAYINQEAFRVIGDWYHSAILELTFLPDFNSEAAWISKKLGISQVEAKLAFDRLLKLGLLYKENEKFNKSNKFLRVENPSITSSALRKLQKDFLKKAICAIDDDPIEKRCAEAMTMAIDPKKIPLARKIIRNFTKELCEVLEDGNQEKLYQLNVVLFQLQKEE